MPKSRKTSKSSPDRSNIDLKAIALIRQSGLLNPDAKLDEVLRFFEQTGTSAKSLSGAHLFIYTNYVFSGCL
jgi:hypothetical protein